MGEACNPSQFHINGSYPSITPSRANQYLATHPKHPQVDERPIAPKADHPVKVMGSHHHLRASNVEGVDCVPSPLSQALHQNGAGKALQQQASDGLKARNTYVALGLLSHDLVP